MDKKIKSKKRNRINAFRGYSIGLFSELVFVPRLRVATLIRTVLAKSGP
jgi:hypothetical protein